MNGDLVPLQLLLSHKKRGRAFVSPSPRARPPRAPSRRMKEVLPELGPRAGDEMQGLEFLVPGVVEGERGAT